MLHTIFDQQIYIKENINLDTFEKYRKMFTSQLVNLSEHVNTAYKNSTRIQKRGEVKTTSVGYFDAFDYSEVYMPLSRVSGYKLLEKLLEPSIIEARNLIYKDAQYNKFLLKRSWNNINYKHSYVVSHMHDKSEHGEKLLNCIFYLEAPYNSGKLAIINDKTKDLSCLEFDQDKVHYITVQPNMLICHTGDVNHAVSEHLSDDRRICVIFEYILE